MLHLNKYIKNIHFVRTAITLFCVLFLLFFFRNCLIERGKTIKEDVIHDYLTALEQKNEELISSLIPETHNAEKEIYDKIFKFGGHSLQNVNIIYISEFGPQMAKVTIQANYTTVEGEKKRFEDEVYLQKIRTRWYLVLGKHKQGISETFPETKP